MKRLLDKTRLGNTIIYYDIFVKNVEVKRISAI